MQIFQRTILINKVAIITGGCSGIGFQISKQFLIHGASIVIISRKQTNIDPALSQLQKLGNVIGVVGDVRKPQDCNKIASQAINKFKRLDILVNGAAGNFLVPFKNLTTNGFKTVMQIDAMGTFNMCKAFYHAKQKTQMKGCIINISATLHYAGTALQIHAGSAKAAIDAMTKHLSVQLGPLNIRVNGIAPGPIQGTQGFQKLNPDKQKNSDQMKEYIPLQRIGKKIDIANISLFLASDAAAYITGHTIVADGGQILTSPNFPINFQLFRKQWIKPKPKL